MSYGNIIVSSTAPPMQEFFRESARYYETGNVKELANLIINTSRLSTTEKDDLSKAALRRARDFSWEDTCNKTVNEFHKAIVESANR
jgi:glycosyltransferase involved in cell wall biosynthesis